MNDPTARREYPALVEKGQDLDNQLARAKSYNLLSAKQLNRLKAIQNKMVTGALMIESQ